ncbi:hypothetical protein AURDEDRAFT_152591 [Auricularia subglabra TFB-10046 SS5]|nr:hypothetical protein AURDEDRAFT_152591 [Auricularia subglabra TFB-10046 SS5]
MSVARDLFACFFPFPFPSPCPCARATVAAAAAHTLYGDEYVLFILRTPALTQKFVEELATSPPRQLRSAASNGSFTAGGTLKLKQGRPRAPVPVSVLTNDPLWDAAARSVPKGGDSRSTSPVPTLSEFPPPPRPQLELDLSSLPPPRRRVRKDHLQRCITLQHGMLRESRALDNEPDVLSRLSLYDDALSPLDLLGAASAVEPPVREEDEYALDSGPRTAPSIMGRPPPPRVRRSPAPSPARTPQHEQQRNEYFPTMAEILAAQDAEDAAQASLDASRTPDRSPMPPSSPSGTLMAVDDASSTHLQFPASLYPDLEPPRSAMSFPQTPAYTESIFPLSEKHQSLYPDTEPPNSATFPNTPAYTRSIFPLTSERHNSMYPETEAPRSPSDSVFPARDRHRSLYPETEAPRSPSDMYHDPKHVSMQYPETEAPRSPADSVFPRPSLQYPETEAPRSPADSVFPGAAPSLLYPETEAPRSPSLNEPHALLYPESAPPRPDPQHLASETPAYSAMVFPHTPSASTVAHLSHATSLDAFVFPPRAELNHSTSTLTPSNTSFSPSAASTAFAQAQPSTPATSPREYNVDQEEEDPDTDGELDIVSPHRPASMLLDRPRSAHFQSEPRHSVLTMGYPETEPRLSAMYEQLSGAPLLTATTARFSGLSVAATSRGVPSLSPTVAYEQRSLHDELAGALLVFLRNCRRRDGRGGGAGCPAVVMTLLHPPSPRPAPSEYISKPIPLQEQAVHLHFPRSTPPEKTQFEPRQRNDSLPPFARPRNDSLDQRSRNGSFDTRARKDSLDHRQRADSIDQRQRNDSLPSRSAHESLQVPPTPMSPPAPTPPPKTNSVLRLAQRVQAQREGVQAQQEEEPVRAFHLPTTGRRDDSPGPPPIPLPAAPVPAPAPVGLPAHPAQHVRGLSNASSTAPLQLTLPHQRKGSLQPASAAPSSFKFVPPPPERPGMNRSQSEQALRQKALLGALRAESGYFDSDEEEVGKGDEEDALEALKREMIEWREGVARESEKRALAEQEAARRKAQEEKRVPVMVEDPQPGARTPPRKVRKKRVPVVEMCERCGFERDSGECVLAHATPGPAVSLVRRSSSRSITHERKDSGASSIGFSRGLQRRATLHDRKDSASSTIGAPRHAHDRRDSLARLNSALFASTTPSAPPKTAPVTSHERTMSMMSGMSNASSFFSSDINEIVLPGGRSFVSALEKLNTVSTAPMPTPSLRQARSTERLPLPPPVTTPTAASHKRGQSTEKFPTLRPVPSTERFAPPPPPSTLKKMPSTERFASIERFAAFRERFGAGSDSTHNTFVTATQAGTSDFSHTAPPLSSEASTVVAYASVSASASAESSWSSFPPTPADADWEYAFSATKPGLQRQQSQQQLRGQRSQEGMRRAVGPALGSATISSTRGRAFAQQTSVYVPDDERDAEPEPQPKSASRWSEDSTRHAPRDKAPSKQASRTNLNSPSVTRLVRAPSVHSPGGSSESPATPVSGGNAFSGLAKRLRLKSLPSKKNQGGGGGFGFSRLGTLVVKNKNSAHEMRSGWMG